MMNTTRRMTHPSSSIFLLTLVILALLSLIQTVRCNDTSSSDDTSPSSSAHQHQHHQHSHFHDTYLPTPNSNPYNSFNEKYFVRSNQQMKEEVFKFHARREPLIVVYVDKQIFFYDRASDFEHYGFDPSRSYHRTYTLESYDIMKTFAHSSLYLYERFATRLLQLYAQQEQTKQKQQQDEDENENEEAGNDIAQQMKLSKVELKLWASNSVLDNQLIREVSQFMRELNDLESDMPNLLKKLCVSSSSHGRTTVVDYAKLIRSIVQVNRDFVSQVFRPESTVTFHQLEEQFAQRVIPLLMQTTELAVRSTLTQLNHLVERWRLDRRISKRDFARTRVLIISGASPRRHCMQSQFFLRLFNQTRMGDRVIYAENMYQASQAIERLRSVYHDLTVGQSFFEDKFRMQRDLLDEVTARFLRNCNKNSRATRARHDCARASGCDDGDSDSSALKQGLHREYSKMVQSCPYLTTEP